MVLLYMSPFALRKPGISFDPKRQEFLEQLATVTEACELNL